ncbi:MAG: TlyA family RNA methyltransferase [Desulfobacterales bacterium]|nr:TlyA family RNA methyltransferase [Desulfobacterales bacterium]
MRIDQLLVDKGLVESRQKAQALILAGKVLVNREPVTKAGTRVLTDAELQVKQDEIPYVSRGALKLENALKTLDIDIADDVCLDIGASTGGFTDCLLRFGASRVYAVDVGYGQLAWSLRQDERVVVLERTNVRYLTEEQVPEKVDVITSDASFISLKLVIPAALPFLKKGGRILALIKPQFEVGKGKVGKGGVVKDPAVHEEVVESLSQFFQELGLERESVIPSPILGPKGNREFIISLKY